MTLRPFTRYALLLITFSALFHIHAQPLPAVADCNVATVADSNSMLRPTDYPSALRQRVDSLLVLPLLEHSQLGLCIYDLTADSLLLDCGRQQCLRPASCQKLITAAAAIETLGSDYRLSTTLLINPSDSSLIIRAGFDPLFGADDMHAFADAVRQAGITTLKAPVILDCSIKDTLRMGWGWCWDDDNPPLSALLYNGRNTFLSHLRTALADVGIPTPDSTFYVRYATAPPKAQPIAVRTHTLQQVLQPMLKRSDNLMAEAVFYHLAAHAGKPFAGRKEATDVITAFVHRALPQAQHFQIADGSGLSLYNYTTPEILVAVLRRTWHDSNLYTTLLPALPIMGKDGTLRRRCHGQSAQHRIWAKTGTVEGVSTLAGYAMAPNGHQLAFAIMNQGIRRTRDGQHFQDLVCNALTTPLRTTDIEPDDMAPLPKDDDEMHKEE